MAKFYHPSRFPFRVAGRQTRPFELLRLFDTALSATVNINYSAYRIIETDALEGMRVSDAVAGAGPF
jgi:hypothetical protein